MKILSRITRDWHIKLLCLALASILWVYVDSLQEKERFMPVDLEVRNVPPGYVVAGDLPETVKVVLRGREESLALVNPQQVTAVVDLRGSSRSAVRRVVRVNQQQIPGGVSIREITPRLVEVQLEKASVKTIEVLPVIEGDLPYGYSLHDVELEPDRVKVRGPAGRLQEVRSVYTGRIDVSGMTETTVLQVPLEPPDHKISLVETAHVSARVVVREEFVVTRVPVERFRPAGLPDGLSCSFAPVSVTALVRVPRRLAEKVGQLSAAADCSGISEPGEYQVPLELEARQSWVEPVNLEPGEIGVTVERSASHSAVSRADRNGGSR